MKAPVIIRDVLWSCERRGSWVSKIGRIEEVAEPRRWVWRPSVVVAAAYPGIKAIGHSMRSCAVLAAVRLAKHRGRR